MNRRRWVGSRPPILTLSFFILLLLSACTGAGTPAAPAVLTPPGGPASLPSTTPTVPRPAQSATPNPLPSPSPTPEFQVCSPLQGIPADKIAGAVTNPYHPPPPGSDEPHAGVDISDLIPGSQIARAGMPIQAVLPGQVAMAQTNRFPFGSALLVETPLVQLPLSWVEQLHLPAPLTAPPAKVSPDLPGRSAEAYLGYCSTLVVRVVCPLAGCARGKTWRESDLRAGHRQGWQERQRP